MSRGRSNKDGNRPSEPLGRVTLAHRELNQVPRDVFLRPTDVRILDIGYNNVTYPFNCCMTKIVYVSIIMHVRVA